MSDTDLEPEEKEANPSAPAKPRRQRQKRIRWTSVFSLTVATLVFVVLALALSGRTVPVPDALRAKIENRLNARLDGTPLRLGPMELGISRNGAPQVLLNNIRVTDASGGAAAQLNWLRAEL